MLKNQRTAFLKKKERDSLRRRRNFKEYRRLRNIRLAEKRRVKIIKSSLALPPKEKPVIVEAPQNFSFRDNPKLVIAFIAKLSELFDKKRTVYVSLTYVTRIDYDAIVVLLSIMIRFKAERIGFNGNFPQDLESRLTLEKSGFLRNLYLGPEEEYEIGRKNFIVTHGNRNFDQQLTAKLIESASVTIWENKRRCPGVQKTLIELMQNTREHADPGKEAEKHWWLSVNHDSQNRKVSFSFIDYGVGIFKSLDGKPNDDLLHKWREKAIRNFGLRSDEKWLRQILNDELLATVTGQYNRGKGLPGIKKALERNQISNLFVITNRVFADVQKDVYQELSHDFQGTFVYFELNTQNQNINES